MLESRRVAVLLLSVAITVIPMQAQFGGPDSAGIPFGTGGGDSQPQTEKPNPAERPVSGVVTDAKGQPVVGAVVELTNTRTKKVVSLITREKGAYRFSGLNKDTDYRIKATFNDHSSAIHTLSTYDSRPTPVVNLQIN